MKILSKCLYIILICIICTGCKQRDNSSETISSIGLETQEYSNEIEEPEEDEFSLLGLSLNEKEDSIIAKLGEPSYSLRYALYDIVAYAELRCFMDYKGFTITTARSLKMRSDDSEGEHVLIEIDITSPEYATYRGIKVGNTIEELTNAYPEEELQK